MTCHIMHGTMGFQIYYCSRKRFMFELGDLFSIYFVYLLCGFLTALSVSWFNLLIDLYRAYVCLHTASFHRLKLGI